MTGGNGPTGGIHLLTTERLIADLVAGRPVPMPGSGDLAFQNEDARAILDWYGRNRGRWSGNLGASDIDAIVSAVGSPLPPPGPAPHAGPAGAARALRLARLVAHNFAGLHAPVGAGPGEAPDDFVFEPNKPVTVLEGGNGTGKTSIANAVAWCLTGNLIRPQRMPEPGTTEFQCEVVRAGATTSHVTSAITPLPRASDPLLSDGTAIPVDTWVEITLVDEVGMLLPPLRRHQHRNNRGKLVETPPDLDAKGSIPWLGASRLRCPQ